MTTIKQVYDILSTFDLGKINPALGTEFVNLGQVYRAQAEAFSLLSDAERRENLHEIEWVLARYDATRTDIN